MMTGPLTDPLLRRLGPQFLDPINFDLLSGCAYDARVGKFLKSRNRQASWKFADKGEYVIESGESVTIETQEEFNFRDSIEIDGHKYYLFALVYNKHTILGKGLFHPTTAVDPGFKGPLALTFINLGNLPVPINAGDPIAKITFFPLYPHPTRIYGTSQRPTVREGSTDFALIMDAGSANDDDRRLAKMYGRPLARLYERFDELERSVELRRLQRAEIERTERRNIWYAAFIAIFSAIVGAVLGAVITVYLEHSDKNPGPDKGALSHVNGTSPKKPQVP